MVSQSTAFRNRQLVIDGYAAALQRQWGLPVTQERLLTVPLNALPPTVPALARALCDHAGVEHADNDADAVRNATEFGSLPTVLQAALEGAVVRRYLEADDSLTGLVYETSVSNFKSQQRVDLGPAAHLLPLGRGGTAERAVPSADLRTIRAARFARSLEWDDRDLVDDRLSVIAESALQIGSAARRVVSDWAFALINQNADMADGVAIFHGDRGNTTVDALSDTSLATGIAAIGKQTLPPNDGNIPINLVPSHLVVVPELVYSASKLVKDAGLRIAVRGDARLGTIGSKNPLTGETHAGGNGRWLLLASPPAAVFLEAAFVGPSRTPTVRVSKPDGGDSIWAADIKLDVAARVAGWRGAYLGGTGV